MNNKKLAILLLSFMLIVIAYNTYIIERAKGQQSYKDKIEHCLSMSDNIVVLPEHKYDYFEDCLSDWKGMHM